MPDLKTIKNQSTETAITHLKISLSSLKTATLILADNYPLLANRLKNNYEEIKDIVVLLERRTIDEKRFEEGEPCPDLGN